jgi:two-component system, OmpR family, phosphate regulon sensor histidine kinase PhoR
MILRKIQWKFLMASLVLIIFCLTSVGLQSLWIQDLKAILFVSFLSTFVLAFLVSYGFSRQLTQPLHEMMQAIRKLARGEFGKKVRSEGHDEVADLASLFNQLVRDWENKFGTISQEHAQLTGILANMVEGVMVLDRHGIILMINTAFERMFQLKSRDVVGRLSLEVLRHYPLMELIKTVLDTRASHSEEIVVETPQELFLHVQASVAVNWADQELCAVLVFHDITEIKRLERVRKDFVANVSHELRTPLTSIKGYIEALLDGAKDDPKQCLQFLQILRNHSDRLNNIISDLLVLSQIESGRYERKREEVRITEMLEKATAILKPMAEKKSQRLSTVISQEVQPLYGDPEKLTQAVVNLLDNAIKYTPEGGEIAVEAKMIPDAIVVIVSDTGMGISRKELLRIFERFYRVDPARSRELGGTGLGLSIVKHIVEAHGGNVSVESQPGKGSQFVLTFPRDS